LKSANIPETNFPLSLRLSAAAALDVIPARTSALLNFSNVPKTQACISKSPIGAEPGFQSLAIASAPPASRIFLAGVKLHPNPIDAHGNATEITLLFASISISLSVLASK